MPPEKDRVTLWILFQSGHVFEAYGHPLGAATFVPGIYGCRASRGLDSALAAKPADTGEFRRVICQEVSYRILIKQCRSVPVLRLVIVLQRRSDRPLEHWHEETSMRTTIGDHHRPHPALTSAAAALAADLKLQTRDYVAVIGDSITEQQSYSLYIEDYC